MSSLKPASDSFRRSRIKSIHSKRASSRRSSSRSRSSFRLRSTTSDHHDYDDLEDLEAEEDGILSCFLDDSVDNEYLLDRVLQDNARANERGRQSDLDQDLDTAAAAQPQVLNDDSKENEEVPPSFVFSISDECVDVPDNSELVQLRPKKTRTLRGSRDHQQVPHHVSADGGEGDAPKHRSKDSAVEPMLQRDHVIGAEAGATKMGLDFTDMAMSREGVDSQDIGLGRAEPIFHKDRPLPNLVVQPPKLIFKPTVTFGCFDIFIGVVAISVYFVDIGTDIELACHYFKQEMWMYGGVTVALIVWPSLVTTLLGLHWYMIDYKKEKKIVDKIKKAKKKAFITPRYVWFLRIFFTLLQMGPVLRITAYLYYGHMSRNKKLSEKQRNRYYHFMIYEDVDSCLLRLFESFLEAAPQLSWQLYIAMVLKENQDVVGTSFRAIALLSSWGSLAISLVSYHRSLRNSNDEKAKMPWSSVPFYFIWRASEIGGRVLVIATFASTFQLWVFGPLLFHWAFMSIWLIAQKTSFYKNTCQEKAFNIICGYVMIFCFLNLREGVTRYRFLLFYLIMYAENFFMLGFWFRFSPDLGEWFHIWGFIVILVLFVLHAIFQLLYYGFFHPTKSIKLCMRCDAYVVYESLCYDLQSTEAETESQPPEILVPAPMTITRDGHPPGTRHPPANPQPPTNRHRHSHANRHSHSHANRHSPNHSNHASKISKISKNGELKVTTV